MKNLILSFLIIFLTTGFAAANKYESAMTSSIQKLNAANSLESCLEATSTFERIGVAEKDKWLPYYYAGLGYIWTSHQTQNSQEIDGYLDKAQVLVNKAKELSPENDEIITLQGYIYMMRVAVDPPSRGQEYSGRAMREFGKAVGMNSDNPRALLLLGKMQMGTDQFFGNDLSESCGIIMKASKMFMTQTSKTKLNPFWGKEMAERFILECSSN